MPTGIRLVSHCHRGALLSNDRNCSSITRPKHLQEGFAYSKRTIGALDAAKITGTQTMFGGPHTIIESSFYMTGVLHEHLGQLIAYARMNGVKPPSSK